MVYELDCSQMQSRALAHEYIARVLGFPAYYGKNLDALFDCLGEMRDDEIVLRNAGALSGLLGQYGQALLDTFCEADDANDRLSVSVIDKQDFE